MRTRSLAILAAVLAAAACSQSKYASYKSLSGDFEASVPRGWNVVTESDGDAFAQATFVGPLDPDFFLGAPSLSVRWYKRYRPRRLRDGRLETYADADDFIAQTLRQVYGSNSVLYGAGRRQDGGREIVSKPQNIVLKESGLTARFFGVLSPTPAPAGYKFGVSRDAKGGLINVRLHDYAVVQMEGGFYVFCYPATQAGYDRNVELFRALVNTFHPHTAGPGGPKVRLPGRSSAS